MIFCLLPQRHSLIALYINWLSSDNTTVNLGSLCELQKKYGILTTTERKEDN